MLIADFGCSDADSGTVLQYILQQNPPTPFRIEETGSPQLLIDGMWYDKLASTNAIYNNEGLEIFNHAEIFRTLSIKEYRY